MSTVSSVLLDFAIFGFVALGVICTVFWARTADLTPDASFTSGAVAVWFGTTLGLGGVGLVGLGAIGGGLAGLATFLISRLRVQPLLASLVVVSVAYSVHWTVLGRPLQSIPAEASWFSLGSDNLNAALATGLILTTGAVLLFLAKTQLGLTLRAAAENPDSVPRGHLWAHASSFVFLVLGNGLVGTGGALFASRAYFVEINMGVGILISGLGAVLLGWSLTGFRQRPLELLLGGLVGAGSLRAIVTVALLMGLSAQWFRALSAAALLGCLLLASSSGRKVLQGLRL